MMLKRAAGVVLFAMIAGAVWLVFAIAVVAACNRLLNAGISDEQRGAIVAVTAIAAAAVGAVMYWREP